VYVVTNPSLNCEEGFYNADSITETVVKNLQVGDAYITSNSAEFTLYHKVLSIEFIEDQNKIRMDLEIYSRDKRGKYGRYSHIVGNGKNHQNRSNAHTLDWEGNGWFAGDVYVGSTSGVNKDEGSKKLLTSDDLVQSDWNQNDETALDYVKNRPFYDTEEYEWIEILNNPEI
jgi:hypothetical protein